MPTVNVQYSKNFNELVKAEKAGKLTAVLIGGSGSGKTFSFLQYIVYRCLTKKTSCIVGRLDRATCRLSCTKDFLHILEEQFQCFERDRWNKSELTYTFANGSTVNFVGLSDPSKARGPRCDIAAINEGTECSEATFQQISARSKMTIVDFNPVAMGNFWGYELKKSPDTHYVTSTWRDNPAIPEQNKRKILSWEPTLKNKAEGTANQYLWSVYSLGKPARREGAIYQYTETEFWPDPIACSFRCYGLDFGFSADPSALVEVCLHDNQLYMKEHLYETELIIQKNPDEPNIPSIEGRLEELGIERDVRIWADNARPEAIRALKLAGWNIEAAPKGPDSIMNGINLVKQHKIRVHHHSMNLKNELNMYSWKQQGYNNFIAVPEDKNNHLCDAFRMVANAKLKPRKSDVFLNKRRRKTGQVGGLVC